MVCLDKQMIRAYKFAETNWLARMDFLKGELKFLYVMLRTINEQMANVANDDHQKEYQDVLNAKEEKTHDDIDGVLKLMIDLLPETSNRNSTVAEINSQIRHEILEEPDLEPQAAAAAEEMPDPE